MNDYTLYLVKRAYYKKQLIKQAEETQQQPIDFNMMDRLRNREHIGAALAMGLNGHKVPTQDNPYVLGMADHTLKSRGRQLAAIGTIGAGAVGGGYVGNKATDWLNNKLGLTKDRGGWRKWLGRGLNLAGTLGGIYLGGKAGATLAGTYAGKLDPEAQKDAINAQKTYMNDRSNKANGVDALDYTARQIKPI